MSNNIKSDSAWIFHGEKGRFASGVFTSISQAEDWIEKHKLTGVLTEYPFNVGVYDWSIENGMFEAKKEVQRTSEFIQTFTSAGQEHFHYEHGIKD